MLEDALRVKEQYKEKWITRVLFSDEGYMG